MGYELIISETDADVNLMSLLEIYFSIQDALIDLITAF